MEKLSPKNIRKRSAGGSSSCTSLELVPEPWATLVTRAGCRVNTFVVQLLGAGYEGTKEGGKGEREDGEVKQYNRSDSSH